MPSGLCAPRSPCARIEELNREDEWLDLQVRVGVNTGEALVVLGARTSEGEGMASGDVMNTAARVQSAAPVNGILVGELTYVATRDAIEYCEAEPIAAKGKSEPVRVWEAVGVREAAAFLAPPTARSSGATPSSRRCSACGSVSPRSAPPRSASSSARLGWARAACSPS